MSGWGAKDLLLTVTFRCVEGTDREKMVEKLIKTYGTDKNSKVSVHGWGFSSEDENNLRTKKVDAELKLETMERTLRLVFPNRDKE